MQHSLIRADDEDLDVVSTRSVGGIDGGIVAPVIVRLAGVGLLVLDVAPAAYEVLGEEIQNSWIWERHGSQ